MFVCFLKEIVHKKYKYIYIDVGIKLIDFYFILKMYQNGNGGSAVMNIASDFFFVKNQKSGKTSRQNEQKKMPKKVGWVGWMT